MNRNKNKIKKFDTKEAQHCAKTKKIGSTAKRRKRTRSERGELEGLHWWKQEPKYQKGNEMKRSEIHRYLCCGRRERREDAMTEESLGCHGWGIFLDCKYEERTTIRDYKKGLFWAVGAFLLLLLLLLLLLSFFFFFFFHTLSFILVVFFEEGF